MDDIFTNLLQQRLATKLGVPVELTITDNIRSMISVRKKGDAFRFRMHHMFLDANDALIDDMVSFARQGSSTLIQPFIDSHTDLINTGERKDRKIRVQLQGDVYDLRALFKELNQTYFENRCDCTLTWGKKSSRKNRRSILFGSYNPDRNLIRINPKLDSRKVPLYFVRYVLYHEMLHQEMGIKSDFRHTKEFRTAEKQFAEYDRAIAWQRRNIRLFIK